MITNLKTISICPGEIIFPKLNYFAATPVIGFGCTWEMEGARITLSITVVYRLEDKHDQVMVEAPCVTTVSFVREGVLTVEELMPIWKVSFKHLRDECNKSSQHIIHHISYPSNDVFKSYVQQFLDASYGQRS